MTSGLMLHVPTEKMQGLSGILLCNLKFVKMRSIEPQGMLVCVNDAIDRVEPPVNENLTELTLSEMIYVQDHPDGLMSTFHYRALGMLLLLS